MNKYNSMLSDFSAHRNLEAGLKARELQNDESLTSEQKSDVEHVLKRTRDCLPKDDKSIDNFILEHADYHHYPKAHLGELIGKGFSALWQKITSLFS